MAKLTKAQQKMIDRLASGNYKISSYGYIYARSVGGNSEHFGLIGKANENTIEALRVRGLVNVEGDPNGADYRVTLAATDAASN